mgnify:CR=1 FL=1
MLELSTNDKKQLEGLNISVEQVERQVNQFKTGFPGRARENLPYNRRHFKRYRYQKS